MVKGSRCSEDHKRKVSEALRGRTFSEEHRTNLSKAKTGKSCPEDVRRKIRDAQTGRVFTEEHKRKMSEAHRGKQLPVEQRARMAEAKAGPKNPRWCGGISFEPYSLVFNENLRDLVRERDGYTCRLCGKAQRDNGRRLSVHHIDYSKKDCSMENLVALCLACHASVNTNRKYWTDYFREAKSGCSC